MIARNYLRHGFRFLWPQIDWAGSAPGYVGTEFPLVPSIAALAYMVVGVHEWVGRAVSVGGFALASLFIYRVLTIVTSERSALFGMAAFASFPLSIFASRCLCPTCQHSRAPSAPSGRFTPFCSGRPEVHSSG